MGKKKDNKTILGTIGALLLIFGIIGTVPIILNKVVVWLPLTALTVIVGVILIAKALSD